MNKMTGKAVQFKIGTEEDLQRLIEQVGLKLSKVDMYVDEESGNIYIIPVPDSKPVKIVFEDDDTIKLHHTEDNPFIFDLY